jgi:hypothetical protein
MFKIGDKIKIKGKISYGQDMAFWSGSFGKIIFEIKDFINNSYKLISNGYGELDKTKGTYGNGAIYVSKKYEDKFILL